MDQTSNDERRVSIRIISADGNPLRGLTNRPDPTLDEVIPMGEGSYLTVKQVSRPRDAGAFHILELVVHFTVSVGAHFVAGWLHDKLKHARAKVAIDGGDPRGLDTATLEAALQRLLDARPPAPAPTDTAPAPDTGPEDPPAA